MLQVSHLSKSYGGQVVFDDASFLMIPGERLGLVGRNGSGKTTLFRMLLGQETQDSGHLVMPKGYRVGHLSQHLTFNQPTILDEACAGLDEDADPHQESWRAEAALMGLGFEREDLCRPASQFSGGFQIRVNLARVLVAQPNLLLLDEPTNYLDILSVRWLQKFLRNWPGELMVITHDRGFLDQVTTHSMAVHRGKLRRMEGTVEKLYDQIDTEEAVYESTRQNELKKRRQEERFIERFRSKASKARQVQSRVRALEKRGSLEALADDDDLRFRFRAAPFQAPTLLKANDITFGYPGGPTLIEGLDLTVENGDRLGIIGRNGRGKTTLLDLLAGELKPTRGQVTPHVNARLAAFGQTNIARLDETLTVEQEILAARPDQTRTAVRTLCGLLMFSGQLAEKKVSVLSGGERSRVLLGRLLVSPSNLLLLDEPTNHLDLESVEGLLDAVDEFPGGVIMVTHSESILERLATRLVVFDGGKVFLFEGTYRDFLSRVGWADEREEGSSTPRKKAASKDLRRQRAQVIEERSRATAGLRKAVERTEAAIERLEQEVARCDAQMLTAAEQGRNDDLARAAADAKARRASIDASFEVLERQTAQLDEARSAFDARLAALES